MAKRKPKIDTHCPADAYTLPHEKIIEYSLPGTKVGGLIHFYVDDDGMLYVSLYRHDPSVGISVSKADFDTPPQIRQDGTTVHITFPRTPEEPPHAA